MVSDPKDRKTALMFCPHVSGAVKDNDAIQSTINIKEAGWLSINKMADAEVATVSRLLATGGIQNDKAKNLIQFCREVRDRHGGYIPTTMAELTQMT